MDPHKLVHMANQIGAFFEAEPDRAAALDAIANHIKRFWDPRMRREILAWVDEHGGEGLQQLVLEALRTHGPSLRPG
ncbi:MAG TPA: formate dehydrogenase subunit delta [Burkholderiales bacterium]|nr:formate dehydrogenase subunit delta [Burkholderiales bacterium]